MKRLTGSFRQYAYPLRVNLRASRYYVRGQWLLHIFAALSAIALTWADLYYAPFLLIVLISAVYFHCFSTEIHTLHWDNDGRFFLNNSDEKVYVLQGFSCFSWMVVLNLKDTEGSRWFTHVVILHDSTDAETFRRLRVRLKIDA